MFQEILNKIGVEVDVTFNLIFLSLIWVRILGMSVVIPFLLGKPVPKYVLVGATMVLALFAFPNLVPKPAPPLTHEFLTLFMLYLKEVFYGFSMGFGVSILFYGIQSAGQMVDNQRGMSIARILIPQLGQQAAISSVFLFQLAIVLYLSIGGHRLFLDSFFMSFTTLPVMEFPTAAPGLLPLMDLFIKITGQVIFIAMQLATPVIIAIFLSDIILGIANRIAPQINVWQLGFTLKGYIGVLMLFLSLTMVGDRIVYYAEISNINAEMVIHYLQQREIPEKPKFKGLEEGLPNPENGPPEVISP